MPIIFKGGKKTNQVITVPVHPGLSYKNKLFLESLGFKVNNVGHSTRNRLR